MKVYQLRVSLMAVPKLYRLIDASENCSFEDLHEMIFMAFNRYDPHLYSFFVTKKDTKNIRAIYDSPEITHPQNVEDVMGFGKKKSSAAKTRIGDADFTKGDVFHYLFDFGDDWWHRIRVQKIGAIRTNKKCLKLIKSVGVSPAQYPDYDDEYE